MKRVIRAVNPPQCDRASAASCPLARLGLAWPRMTLWWGWLEGDGMSPPPHPALKPSTPNSSHTHTRSQSHYEAPADGQETKAVWGWEAPISPNTHYTPHFSFWAPPPIHHKHTLSSRQSVAATLRERLSDLLQHKHFLAAWLSFLTDRTPQLRLVHADVIQPRFLTPC